MTADRVPPRSPAARCARAVDDGPRACGRARRTTALLAAGLVATAALTAATPALAHATLVIGTVSFSPDPPGGAPELLATVRLEDPGLVEVEDAVVVIELRALAEPSTAPAGADQPVGDALFTSERLRETEPGTYQIGVPAPPDGTYLLSVRDRTYRQEEAVANLVIDLTGTEIGEHAFVLPPTATGPAALGTWLVWLIGVPLLAGALVTVLVLRGGRSAVEDEEARHQADGGATASPAGDDGTS